MRDYSALRLDARRYGRAAEVQRNADADLLVLFDALKVDVHDGVLERMALHILQDRRLRFISDLQIEDGRVEALILEHDQQLLMVQRQGARGKMPAIEYCRNFSVVTQAAARTFALRLAELGNEFKRGLHNLLQLHHKYGSPAPRPVAKGPAYPIVPSIDVQRTHRLLVADAPYGFRQ